jgi:hypothetical protein
MTQNPKRIPGEKNPVADSSEVDQTANAAQSSQMQGLSTSGGVISSGLFGLLAARRERRAKKNAIAAWEAQRSEQQR